MPLASLSDPGFAGNVELTARVCELARRYGASLEAELGKVGGAERTRHYLSLIAAANVAAYGDLWQRTYSAEPTVM